MLCPVRRSHTGRHREWPSAGVGRGHAKLLELFSHLVLGVVGPEVGAVGEKVNDVALVQLSQP
ncbi:hypothetical protein [Streptosporangium sandarakinum]|uniref:hypothetical protein n=1 Tax=Streptosporangium sandarakinum TaxID=1260955 RepID=UPI0033A1DD94